MAKPRYSGLITFSELQAQSCETMGSPFNAGLCRAAAAALTAGDELEGLFEAWAERGFRSTASAAVTLRLLGALHDLALSGDAPELTAAYPREGFAGDPAAAWRAGRAAMGEMSQRFAAFLAHEPQTNEVRRSACLLPGFLTIAAETGLPLRCFELGASAGLNLIWDSYRYRLGDAPWGPADSPVTLATQWRGPRPPLEARIEVVERAACDRRPVDLADPAERRRLLAYIWPDQLERLATARAAIAMAADRGVQVEKADAGQWAEQAGPAAGRTTVLYHSIFWQYLAEQTQGQLEAVTRELGAAAQEDAPFAWLRMEPPPGDLTRIDLWLTVWPGGGDRRLAVVHPHGAFVDWQA